MSNAEDIKKRIENGETNPSLNDGEQLLSYLNQLYENAQNKTVSQSGAVKMCLSSIVPHIEKAIDGRSKTHTNQTLQELKENFAEELPHNITKVIYSETELNNEESHELAQKVITLIDEAINE